MCVYRERERERESGYHYVPPHRANDQLNVYRQMSPRFQTFQRRYRVWLVRCTVLHVEALQFQIPTEKENVALNCGYLRPIR